MVEKQKKSIENSDWISLADGEEVKHWCHPSLYAYALKISTGILISIISVFIPFIYDPVGLWGWLGVPLGIILFALGYLEYITEFYVFTNQRVLHKWGLISHRVKSVGYDDILKKEPTYPLWGRLLGYGHLRAVTATPDTGDVLMKYMPDMDEALTTSTEYDND